MASDAERGADSLSREELLAAWQDARREISRAEQGLAARSRELDLLQTLGRRAAESNEADELFETTVRVLHEGSPLDLVLAAFPGERSRRRVADVSRPVDERCVEALARKASELLGWPPDEPALERRESAMFDAARGSRSTVSEQELVLLPVVRRGARSPA